MSDERFEVTTASTDVSRAEVGVQLPRSDVVLIDPFLEGGPATSSIASLLDSCPNVVIYSGQFEPQFFLGALLAGIRGYISKSGGNGRRLADLVWTLVRHNALIIDREFAEYFWSSPAERVVLYSPSDSVRGLTPREREIVQLLGTGVTDGEIAIRFGLSLSTVQTHVQNIERKLGARSRFDLAVRAIRTGLINLSAQMPVD